MLRAAEHDDGSLRCHGPAAAMAAGPAGSEPAIFQRAPGDQPAAHIPRPQRDGVLSTAVRVSVQEQWKGRRRSRLRLLLPRGTEGGIAQEVPGAPTFQIGEEVILFVVREAPGQYRVVGGKQGKFSIKTDPRSGQRVVEDLTGTRFDLTPFLRRLSRGP